MIAVESGARRRTSMLTQSIRWPTRNGAGTDGHRRTVEPSRMCTMCAQRMRLVSAPVPVPVPVGSEKEEGSHIDLLCVQNGTRYKLRQKLISVDS